MPRCREPQTLRFSPAAPQQDVKLLEFRVKPSDRPLYVRIECSGSKEALDSLRVNAVYIQE
jgi:hypothetical protein